MAKKTMTGVLLVAMCGSMLGFGGGCLGDGFLGFALRDAALDAAWEFVLDNDAVFDLFQDDFGTGALFDDRNTAAPARAEP